jgi:PAS domain S-box-containing protein
MTPPSKRENRNVRSPSDATTGETGNRAEKFVRRYNEVRDRASSELGASENYEHDLTSLLDAAVPDFCDWCAIDLLGPDNAKHRFAHKFSPANGTDEDTNKGAAQVEQRVTDLDAIARRALMNRHPEEWPVTDARTLPYCIVVGLWVNEEPFGTVAFVANEGSPGFSSTDAEAVQEVALAVSTAVERSILHRDAREAIRHTQKIASQLHQLIATSIAVAGLQNEGEVLRRFAQSARSVFDADRALVTHEHGLGEPIYAIAERSGITKQARPADESTIGDLSRFRAKDFALRNVQGWCIAPLLVNRVESRGVIAIESGNGSDFGTEEREVLTLLAQMASTALGALELNRTIQRSEARWRVLVETAPVGIVEVDLEGNMHWWNRAAAKIFAWPDFREVAEQSAPALPSTLKDRFEGMWSEALRGSLEGSRDFQDVEISGRLRHLTASAVPLPSVGTETRSLLTLIDDVTNQRELKQELRHAHQMELRGQVASSVAHDFNNLLTLISGYAEILSQDLASDDHEMEMVRNIQTTASRASQLTGRLQAIGRTQSTESVVLNPVDLIRSNAEVLERIVGVDIEVVWSLESSASNVKVDADQFEQMILNLAINARDAMPNGGRLIIAARDVAVDAQAGSQLDLPEGNYVMISVADTGIGMDEETQKHCFDPLFTTKGPFKGTGMGLAAARRLLEESGGVIRSSSALGQGTTFEVFLPASLEGASVQPPREQTERPRGSAEVLLAEDDEGLRTLMAQVLGRNGYVVVEAASAEQALELARTRESPIDVLISDVVMDMLSGPELARSLQGVHPSLRVLFISGTADATVLDVLTEGTGTFLAKPFKPSELIDAIHELLERQNPDS